MKIADTERKGAGMFSVLNENMTVDSVRLSGTTIQIAKVQMSAQVRWLEKQQAR